MSTKTLEQKLAEEQAKIEKKEKELAELKRKFKEKSRRERAHRLIEVGAVLCQYFNDEFLNAKQAKMLLDQIVSLDEVKKILDGYSSAAINSDAKVDSE